MIVLDMDAENAEDVLSRATLFNIAFHTGQVQYVVDEVEMDHYDVNSPDLSGHTALHYAGMIQNIDTARIMIAYLVAKGADVNAQGDDGGTPLDYANFDQSPIIGAYLIRYGAKTSQQLVDDLNGEDGDFSDSDTEDSMDFARFENSEHP